jgi:hypothetical protein
LVIDYNRRGKPIGIEITAPARLSAPVLNRVLRRLGVPTVTRADLARCEPRDIGDPVKTGLVGSLAHGLGPV